jgi:hypothetical protein
MSIRDFQNGLRVLIVLNRELKRYPERRRARKLAAEVQRKKRAIADAELAWERNALTECIRQRGLEIDQVELTNALGYYSHHGADLAQAHCKYRLLLQSGGRMPGKKGDCEQYGRELRKELKMSTADDRAYIEARYLAGDSVKSIVILSLAFVLFVSGPFAAHSAEELGLLAIMWFFALFFLLFGMGLRGSVQRRKNKK